jgi:hypothetical protein
MAVIRTTRFMVAPDDIDTMLARRRRLLDVVRGQFGGPSEARLVQLDGETWLDTWRWDSPEALDAALAAAPGLAEAGAAFALTRDVSAEQGRLVDEDVWAR